MAYAHTYGIPSIAPYPPNIPPPLVQRSTPDAKLSAGGPLEQTWLNSESSFLLISDIRSLPYLALQDGRFPRLQSYPEALWQISTGNPNRIVSVPLPVKNTLRWNNSHQILFPKWRMIKLLYKCNGSSMKSSKESKTWKFETSKSCKVSRTLWRTFNLASTAFSIHSSLISLPNALRSRRRLLLQAILTSLLLRVLNPSLHNIIHLHTEASQGTAYFRERRTSLTHHSCPQCPCRIPTTIYQELSKKSKTPLICWTPEWAISLFVRETRDVLGWSYFRILGWNCFRKR